MWPIHAKIDSDTDDAQSCVTTDAERPLRLRSNFGGDEVTVVIQECNAESSTWTNKCDRQSTTLNITQICEHYGKSWIEATANCI